MKLFYFIIFLFLYGGVFADNQIDTIRESKDLSNRRDIILCANILGPVAFYEAGLGVILRDENKDYYFYLNYKFSFDEDIVTYFPYEHYGLVKPSECTNSISGIDIGAQLRFRGQKHISKKSYAKYIKEAKKKTAFYMGMSTEVSYAHCEEKSEINNTKMIIENWIWTPKLGAIIGWTFNYKKAYLDIHWSFAFGYSFIAYDTTSSHSIKPVGREYSGAWIYKPRFALLLGYKL